MAQLSDPPDGSGRALPTAHEIAGQQRAGATNAAAAMHRDPLSLRDCTLDNRNTLIQLRVRGGSEITNGQVHLGPSIGPAGR